MTWLARPASQSVKLQLEMPFTLTTKHQVWDSKSSSWKTNAGFVKGGVSAYFSISRESLEPKYLST